MTLPSDYFVLNLHREVCMCGANYSHSTLYVRTEKGLRPTNFKPAYRPHVVITPTQHIPCCEQCYATLPERPPNGEDYYLHARAAWRDKAAAQLRERERGERSPQKKVPFDLGLLDGLKR